MKTHRWLLSLLILPSLAAAPATGPATALVGPKFESQAAGITLRPPLGGKTVRGPVGSSEIVRFVNDDKKWILKVSRVLLEAGKPLPLSVWKDQAGVERPGMFELTIEQFKSDAPGAQMLRQEITKLGNHSMGQMAAKYDFGLETNLTQEAVIRTSDLQYYVLGMTSPAPRKGDITQDPNVQQAVETFSQVIDSVEILDQTAAKDDRDIRLLRTRLLYANLTEAKLRQLVQGEQWLRIMRDNKDVGYSYIVQDIARDLPRKGGKPEPASSPEGLRIGVRSRMLPQAGVQVDSECWYFTTFDRKYEAFSTLAYTEDPKSGKTTS
ncbi:MAG TPA: hypothetical protein VHD56_13435, partial [Tepidisphaeraceae bacterium]|nr:hypothetical protein [Tepidisphaeraceae bacterium]